MLYDFKDFEESTTDSGKTALVLEEFDSENRGRNISVVFDGKCTIYIILLISYDPYMPTIEFHRNAEALAIVSSMGAELYGFTDNLIDQVEENLPSLRDQAMETGRAIQRINPVSGLEYPEVELELRVYEGNVEAFMYSIIF